MAISSTAALASFESSNSGPAKDKPASYPLRPNIGTANPFFIEKSSLAICMTRLEAAVSIFKSDQRKDATLVLNEDATTSCSTNLDWLYWRYQSLGHEISSSR